MRTLKDEAIGNLHIQEARAFEFFVVYARYEFAAKVQHLVHMGPHPRDLQINPQAVAERIAEKFLAKIETDELLKEALDYYREEPPKKQMWKDGAPCWEPVVYQGDDEIKKTILRLQQARNNLFHGGKGWKGDGYGDRDNKLIKYGLIILDAIVRADDALFNEFTSFA